MSDLAQIRADLNAVLDRIEAVGHASRTAQNTLNRTYIDLYLASIRNRQSVAEGIAECGWDMLLDLYKHEGVKKITVSSACIGSIHPQTTALRHLSVLLEEGLIEREPSLDDARQIFINMTMKGKSAVDHWLGLMAREGHAAP